MKKRFLAMFAVVTFFILSAVPASAVVNDTIKVGLRYGSSAMTSANLENDVGEGYEFGYFDSGILSLWNGRMRPRLPCPLRAMEPFK